MQSGREHEDPPKRREPRAWIVALAVFTLTLTVYLPALDGPFIWDDLQLVFDSPRVMELQPLRNYFGSSFWTRGDVEPEGRNYYRPLSILSLAIDHRIHGANPGGYHLTNGLLHGANVLLLFALLRRRQLEPLRAGLLALAWAWFPRLTEAVAWISGRTDVLATLFVLVALLCSGRQRRLWGWLAAGSALLGLFAKEVAAAGLVAIALWEWHAARSVALPGRFLRILPAAAAACAYAAVRIWAMGVGIRENGLGWAERATSALEAAGRYLWMLVDAWHPAVHIGHLGYPSPPFIVLGGIALLVSAWCAFFFARRLDAFGMAAAAALAMSLGLVFHVVPITVNVVAADRFLYLPTAALALCLAPLLARPSPRWTIPAVSLLVLSYAPVTFARARLWADEVSFWSHAFHEQSRHNAISRLELGNVYARAGMHQHALALYMDADTLDYHNYLLVRHNAGTRFLILGQYAEGKALLEDLVRRAPEIPKFHFALANAHLTDQRIDDAEKRLQIALRLYPDSLASQSLQRTIANLRKSANDPAPDLGTVQGQLTQAGISAQRGRHQEALEHLLKASASPEITMKDLTESMLYAFDWASPRQLESLYERYQARGGSAPAIVENIALRRERVRRLRALWPTLGEPGKGKEFELLPAKRPLRAKPSPFPPQ